MVAIKNGRSKITIFHVIQPNPAMPESKKAQHTDDAKKTDFHGSEKNETFFEFLIRANLWFP
jgi:hypothetical protein